MNQQKQCNLQIIVLALQNLRDNADLTQEQLKKITGVLYDELKK